MDRIFPIDGLTFAKRVLALVSCALALASLTLAPAAAQAPTEAQLRAFEARVVDLVNQEREKVGVSPLAWSEELTNAAGRHSLDMATNNFFGHTGSDGSNPTTRIQDTGYQGSSYGENIVAGYTSAEEAMNAWMNSPGHRAKILDPEFTEIGVALAYNENSQWGYYWTQVFAKP